MNNLEIILLQTVIICLVRISAKQGNSTRKEFNSAQRREELNAAFLSAVHSGDVHWITEYIKQGSLDPYLEGYDSGQIRKLDTVVYGKLTALKLLLSKAIVSVVSDQQLTNDTEDKSFFNITIIPGTELMTKLKLNMTAMKAGQDPTLNSFNPLHIICSLPDVDLGVIKYILDNGIDVNARSQDNATALFRAAYLGNLPLVKLLVERGASINASVQLPVNVDYEGTYGRYMAIFSDKKEHVRPGITVPGSALLYALVNEHAETLQYLLSIGVDLYMGQAGWVAPMLSIICGNKRIFEVLLEHGIDVNTKDLKGATPLHHAIGYHRLAIAKLLLNYGARVNITDNYNWTPFHAAAFLLSNETKELLELLLNADRSLINAKTDGGFTALNLAEAGHNLKFLQYLFRSLTINCTEEYQNPGEEDSDEEHAKIIKLLLDRGADVNHQDDIRGWSTLHWAAASGDLRAVKILLDHGAVVSSKSKIGKSPLELAKYYGMTRVFNYLKEIRP